MASTVTKVGGSDDSGFTGPRGAETDAPRRDGVRLPTPAPGKRLVGYCRSCRCFQELDASCRDHLRHDRHQMAIILELPIDRPLYRIPAFNWGAFLMPPIWGAGHGQVFAVVLYPVWIMVDNLMWAAVHGQGSPVLAGIALAGTLAFMFFYARTANYVGYMRVVTTKSPDEYVAGERRWAVAMGVLAAVMVAFATWYNLTVRA